jgi:hypothetical protein
MKNTIIILATIFCMMHNLYAQDKINIGVKGGINIASMSNVGSASASFGSSSSSNKNKPRILPHFGIYSEIKVNDVFSFQPELLFSMKGYSNEAKAINGFTSSSSETNNKLALSYIDIPLQMRFNFNKFHILAGPYIGFLVAATYKTNSEVIIGSSSSKSESKSTSKENFNSPEAGIYLGAGYELENGLSFGARWCRGLSDVTDNNSTAGNNNSNSVFQISLGYKLASF